MAKKKKLPEIPVPPPNMQKVVALSDFEPAATAVMAWCSEAFFPECALYTDAFTVEAKVDDEQEAQMNEYNVEITFLTEDRDPDWFLRISTFAAALARNAAGTHKRKTSLAINYTELGYAVLIRCIVPHFKLATIA